MKIAHHDDDLCLETIYEMGSGKVFQLKQEDFMKMEKN